MGGVYRATALLRGCSPRDVRFPADLAGNEPRIRPGCERGPHGHGTARRSAPCTPHQRFPPKIPTAPAPNGVGGPQRASPAPPTKQPPAMPTAPAEGGRCGRDTGCTAGAKGVHVGDSPPPKQPSQPTPPFPRQRSIPIREGRRAGAARGSHRTKPRRGLPGAPGRHRRAERGTRAGGAAR